jgi:sphingolipid 4-desaturase/C4-monooxygenase
MSADFIWSNEPEPHRARSLQILRTHPEVRALFGRNALTTVVCVGVVVLQVAIAWQLRDAPWWLLVPVAWGVGAFLSHATFCLYHECAHQLVLRRFTANQLLGIFTNLPTLLPSYASFRTYHLKHHQYQGDYDMDPDLADRWEARLIGNSVLGKACWLALFPIFQCYRTVRFRHRIPILNRWVVLNWAAQMAFNVAVFVFLGPGAFVYLLLSFFFSVGLHPLGARWIQEHFVIDGAQETYSYYGPVNRVAVNIGYHNEHHDFPFIPWNRLPRLTALAPEVYDALQSHRSWGRLWLRFLIDPRISLWSRVARDAQQNGARPALPRPLYAPGTFDESLEGAL